MKESQKHYGKEKKNWHKSVYVWFHLYKVLEQVKLIQDDKSKSGYFRIDWMDTKKFSEVNVFFLILIEM